MGERRLHEFDHLEPPEIASDLESDDDVPWLAIGDADRVEIAQLAGFDEDDATLAAGAAPSVTQTALAGVDARDEGDEGDEGDENEHGAGGERAGDAGKHASVHAGACPRHGAVHPPDRRSVGSTPWPRRGPWRCSRGRPRRPRRTRPHRTHGEDCSTPRASRKSAADTLHAPVWRRVVPRGYPWMRRLSLGVTSKNYPSRAW